MPVATKLRWMGIYNEELSSIKSHSPLMAGPARSREILDLLYFYYHKAYDHQIGKVLTYYKKLSPKMSHNPLSTWLLEVT